jgi:hypothetical protein
VWLRERGFLEYLFATPRCRGGERRQIPVGLAPYMRAASPSRTRKRRTVAGVQASGGPEKRAVIAKPLYGLEGAWYCGPEVVPGRQDTEQVSPQQTASTRGLAFAVE